MNKPKRDIDIQWRPRPIAVGEWKYGVEGTCEPGKHDYEKLNRRTLFCTKCGQRK